MHARSRFTMLQILLGEDSPLPKIKWLRFTNPEIYIPQDSTSRRRRVFDDP